MKILLTAILSLTFFVGCASKQEKKSISSYNKADMQHQIDRAKKAYKDLDKELAK